MTNPLDVEFDQRLDDAFDLKLDELLASSKNVGPEARRKLRGLLKHYAKKTHPFRACVRDNRKRFGPRAEAICATLKDIIRGTTRWRGNPELDKGSAGLSDDAAPEIDDEVLALIDHLSDMDLWALLALADIDEHITEGQLEEFRDRFRDLPVVSIKRDTRGFYVFTAFARSESYPTISAIPKHVVEAIALTSGDA